jgi:large conductance mechanosensitive channel
MWGYTSLTAGAAGISTRLSSRGHATRQQTGERNVLKDFKEFVARGNVVDMAVGIIIGGAFATIVKSLVDDVLMPPIGLLLGGVDFTNFFTVLKEGATPGPYVTVAAAQEAGAVTVNYGLFFSAAITFVIVALAVFLLVRRVNAMRRPEPAAASPMKECPFCATEIPLKATRCPQCTSQLAGV